MLSDTITQLNQGKYDLNIPDKDKCILVPHLEIFEGLDLLLQQVVAVLDEHNQVGVLLRLLLLVESLVLL